MDKDNQKIPRREAFRDPQWEMFRAYESGGEEAGGFAFYSEGEVV